MMYRALPRYVNAFQFVWGVGIPQAFAEAYFTGKVMTGKDVHGEPYILIDGKLKAPEGSWVVRWENGEISLLPNSIFTHLFTGAFDAA